MNLMLLTVTDICYQFIKEKMVDDGKYYILIDEVQNIAKWEKIINFFEAKKHRHLYYWF